MNSHLHRLVFSRSRGCCVAVAETASACGKSASGERRSRVARVAVAALLASASLTLHAQGLPGGAPLTGVAPRPVVPPAGVAPVLPAGATVVKGQGSVSVAGGDMTVNQSSQRLVTDWQSFSIGAGNSVRFVQPSSSAVALNRVTGNDPSSIFGSLVANGHVYLQNANGVYFAPGAQVSVGSLVATSLNVDVDRFMLGELRLSGGSESSGGVENGGRIVAAPGGHVVFAAPTVSNSGSIATPGGTAALVAGNAVDIDPLGSGLLRVSVPVAAVNARLAQSGTITADGGAVQLAAAASDAAVRTVMQVGGVVRARSIEARDGQIVLSGGSSGAVMVDGQLDVSGATGQGGTIKVLGDLVGVTGGARLDASGGTGGGTILVGGNWQGKGPEQNARDSYVGSGVVLDASATGNGDGGKVVVWADGNTNYFGQANARGGANGGDGGRIEVSGKKTLRFEGGADLTAPHGTTGNLLLDPQFLTVGLIADVDGTPPTGDDLIANVFAGDPGVSSQVTAARVATLLNTASVTLQSQFTLVVSAPVTVAAGGAATTLALQSADITIGAPMTLNNASLTVNTTPTFTTQQIVLNAAVSSNNSVSLTSPTITFNAPLTAPNVTLTSGGVISQNSSGAGTIVATNLTVAGAGDADLSFSNNQVGNLVLAIDDASFRVANPVGVPLNISGAADNLTLVAANTNVTQSLAPSGAQTLGGGGGLFAVATTGAGNVTLDNAANQIGVAGMTFNVAGNVSVRTAGALNVDGGIATGDVVFRSGGLFTLDNDVSGRNIDITSVGFEADDTLLLTPAGGRFFIRSSDWTLDNFNSPLFGTGANDINYIVLGGFTGTDPATGNGYYTNRTGTITPPNADNPPITKVYDGLPGFAFNQSGAAATAALQSVSVPINFGVTGYTVVGTGAFTDKNAGVNKGHSVGPTTNTSAVSPSEGGLVYYGLQFAGYTRAPGVHVAGTPGNAISQITPRPITSIGVDGIDRIYDATTTVGVNIGGASLVGTIAGDTVVLAATSATGTMADKNVGVNKPVAVSGLTLTGADAGNYTVTDASAANATITARAITSIGLDGVDRIYDGTTAVAVNGGGGALVGVLGGDTVGVTTGGATGTVANKNVGAAKPVTIVGVGLNGTDAGNYTVTDASGATVAITPRPITAIGLDGVDRVYNGGTAVGVNAGGASLAGTIGGDTVSLVATGATGTLVDKNVGVDKPVAVGGLSLAGTDAGNYTVTAAAGATSTITPLGISSSGFTGVNRAYNGTTAVAVNGGGATLTGVIGGDTVGIAGGATGTVANKNVGTAKPVTVGTVTLNGTDAGNYTVTDASGAVVTITPLGITSTGVTGVDRTYDGTTVVGVNTGGATLNGTIAGDNVTLVSGAATGTMANKNAGLAKPVTVGGLTLAGTDAVNYSLVDASNATVNIAAAVLQASGITAANRVVDGTTVVQLDTTNTSVVGVVPGDTVGVDASGATGSVATPDPGAAKTVTVIGIALTGPDAINYSIAPVPIGPTGGGLTVRFLSAAQGRFDDIRFKEYLQAVSDAQEPFRRAMAEALASGFGKENIRKQLQRGLVFETGLAPPAVDIIDSAAKPETCTPPGGSDLNCGR